MAIYGTSSKTALKLGALRSKEDECLNCPCWFIQSSYENLNLTSVKQIQFLRWIATGFYYQIKRYNACLKGNFNKVCIFTRIVAVIFIRYQKFHDLKTLFDHTHFRYSKNIDVSNFYPLVFYNVFKFHSCIYLEQRQSLLGIMKTSDLDTKLLLFANYTSCVIDKSTVIHAHSRQSWEININYNITRVILLNSKVEVSADFELLIIASRAVNKSCRLYTKKIYIKNKYLLCPVLIALTSENVLFFRGP